MRAELPGVDNFVKAILLECCLKILYCALPHFTVNFFFIVMLQLPLFKFLNNESMITVLTTF